MPLVPIVFHITIYCSILLTWRYTVIYIEFRINWLFATFFVPSSKEKFNSFFSDHPTVLCTNSLTYSILSINLNEILSELCYPYGLENIAQQNADIWISVSTVVSFHKDTTYLKTL